jgi:xylan 1,4-beta-xylosidase
MNLITNPILRGFNPDPSIVRVGDDYFIATSTFEWFPGVQIHHSKDLVNWQLITHPLSRTSQLDMLGNADSGGIWAPCLSWCDGVFYLIYTDVKNWRNNYKESHNYLVTATDILGPWSDPIYLNSSGFDPSLFHDVGGRKWFVNMLWDFRAGGAPGYFAGILLQEFDPHTQQLTGPIRNIFTGSPIGWVEGPHLYHRGDYYYLLTAEGGTGWNHAATMARSRSIDGPYAIDPQNPILTSQGKPALELQKAGHASLVETQRGDWYLVHLCSRPVGPERRCILGRETAIQKCVWTDDGWLRLEHGGNNPRISAPAPQLPEHRFELDPARDDFDAATLNVNFQSLRAPADESWCSLTERPGWLRLYGRESLSSQHRQSLVARRVQAFRCEAATCLEFEPNTFQQMAGLTAFYDATTHYYAYVTSDDGVGKHLNLLAVDLYKLSFPLAEPIKIDGWPRVYLNVTFDHATLQFAYSPDGVAWRNLGPACDATKLSDDYGPESFTGAFVGLCAQDLSGQRRHADFDWFEYREYQ